MTDEANGDHNISALDCWCVPRYLRVCDECCVTISATIHCDEVAIGSPGCWKCEGGTTEITREEAEISEVPLLILHREHE